MTRTLLALCLAGLPLASIVACSSSNRVSAHANRPMGPANGAADFKDNPGGPHVPATVPGPPPGSEPNTPGPNNEECPPKCGIDGSWSACGLKKPRGSSCTGCIPKCKGKGTATEGWYDCNGVLIAERKCG